MSAARVLRGALAVMDGGRRWHKGYFWDGDKCCILGALEAMDEVTAAEQIVTAIARTEYPDRQPGHKSVALFNDHPDTTWADVERVFEKAIAQAEEAAS